tara:strand:- start:335 stop:949 length:615 start_codon:yes stop_codon:yes gene_type:complete
LQTLAQNKIELFFILSKKWLKHLKTHILINFARVLTRTHQNMTLVEFKQIFDLYYTPIKNFLYYKSGDVDLAEDLTQDVFMKLWDKREEINQETVKSYLYTIASNMLLNKFRHDKVVFTFAEKNKDRFNEQSPQYALEEKEFKQQLEQTIAAMPEKQRDVFLMNRIDELTYKEIAERLELSVKAVEKRMHGALSFLRDKVNHKI